MSYFVEPKVAGSRMPRVEDLDKWGELGVRTVISLAEAWEIEYYGRWGLLQFQNALLRLGAKWIHWPTPDGYPPRELGRLARVIEEEARRGVVLVHCVGGIGRTATALAAYLIVARCLDVEEAIREVEKANPNISITQEQYYALLEVEAERECPGRDLNPGHGLERPASLTGLDYRLE